MIEDQNLSIQFDNYYEECQPVMCTLHRHDTCWASGWSHGSVETMHPLVGTMWADNQTTDARH